MHYTYKCCCCGHCYCFGSVRFGCIALLCNLLLFSSILAWGNYVYWYGNGCEMHFQVLYRPYLFRHCYWKHAAVITISRVHMFTNFPWSNQKRNPTPSRTESFIYTTFVVIIYFPNRMYEMCLVHFQSIVRGTHYFIQSNVFRTS